MVALMPGRHTGLPLHFFAIFYYWFIKSMSNEKTASKYTPECPFCGKYIARPVNVNTGLGEVLSGNCACSAVYVCDPTGHNMGEAYSEALALVKGNWDINLLDSDTDYLCVDMDYDLRSHTRIYAQGLSTSVGKLIFVKLKQAEKPQPVQDAKGERMKASKGGVKRLLEEGAYSEIADLAREDKGVLRWLISLSYDKEDVVSWRAMEAVGVVGRELMKDGGDVVRDTVRRMLWSMGDESGGIGWSAAEIIGEIIRNNPDGFPDIVPILWSYREEEMFRAGTVWAMGRIAEVRPDLVRFIVRDLPEILEDGNPAVRGYAVWTISMLEDGALAEEAKKLADDNASVAFYREGKLVKTTVGDIVKEMVSKRSNKQNKQ